MKALLLLNHPLKLVSPDLSVSMSHWFRSGRSQQSNLGETVFIATAALCVQLLPWHGHAACCGCLLCHTFFGVFVNPSLTDRLELLSQGCSCAGRVLVWHTQSSELDTQSQQTGL